MTTGQLHRRHWWLLAWSAVVVVLAATTLFYVLASVGVRMNRGEWVRSLGPVGTDAQQLEASQDELQERLRAAEATIADLKERLQESNRRYGDLRARMTPTDPDPGGADTP